MRDVVGLRGSVFIHIILSELLFCFLSLLIHKGIELLNVELTLGEIQLLVEVGVYHS